MQEEDFQSLNLTPVIIMMYMHIDMAPEAYYLSVACHKNMLNSVKLTQFRMTLESVLRLLLNPYS